MSIYAAQGELQADHAFQQRVSACITKETLAWEEGTTVPIPQILADIIADVAASPGFAEKFLWGDQAGAIAPGQLAITDGDILGAVQPMLPPYQAAPPA